MRSLSFVGLLLLVVILSSCGYNRYDDSDREPYVVTYLYLTDLTHEQFDSIYGFGQYTLYRKTKEFDGETLFEHHWTKMPAGNILVDEDERPYGLEVHIESDYSMIIEERYYTAKDWQYGYWKWDPAPTTMVLMPYNEDTLYWEVMQNTDSTMRVSRDITFTRSEPDGTVTYSTMHEELEFRKEVFSY